MPDSRHTRKGGAYLVDGTPYPSVTTVISALRKPALEVWLQKNIYEACQQGDITFSEALKYSRDKTAKAAHRGTRAHAYIENGDMATKPDLEIAPLIYAYKSWVSDYNPKIILSEETVFNHEHQYAGTVDMVAEIDGLNYLVDIKTGKSIYETVYLQTSAYKKALEPTIKIDRVAVLLLKVDHNGESTTQYEFREIEECHFDAFKALLGVYNWTKAHPA